MFWLILLYLENLLRQVESGSLSSMTKLSSIDLSENNFVGSLPDLTKLVHLSVFDGSNNQFEDNMFSIFFYNPNKFPLTIKVLQLSNNKITGSFSDKYWFTFQTSILDLSGNNLSTTSNSSLKLLLCSCFSEVHAFIDLSRNPQFSAALPDCVLKHSKELTHVDIDVRFTALRGNNSINLYKNIKMQDDVTLRS